jgi:hypothetical protein
MNKLVYVCMVFSSKYETMLGYRSRRKLSFPFGTVKSFARHHQVVAETWGWKIKFSSPLGIKLLLKNLKKRSLLGNSALS